MGLAPARSRHSGIVVSLHLTIFAIVIMIPFEALGAYCFLSIALIGYIKLCDTAESIIARRRMERAERRAEQRGDVTTELATAPGESSSYP